MPHQLYLAKAAQGYVLIEAFWPPPICIHPSWSVTRLISEIIIETMGRGVKRSARFSNKACGNPVAIPAIVEEPESWPCFHSTSLYDTNLHGTNFCNILTTPECTPASRLL
jgi:hypothetical protein